jgi:Ca2+-binding EF-hand superfamily protein
MPISDLALLGLAVVLLSALPGFTAASEEETRPAEVRTSRFREVLQRWDKDGDGRLNDDERAAMKKALLAKHDADGDGHLSEAEREAAVRARDLPTPRASGEAPKGRLGRRLLENFDKDRDGQLSDEERQAARDTVRKQRAGP